MIPTQEKRFAFDQAFDAETGNQRLFEATTQPLIGRGLQTHTEVDALSPNNMQSSTFNCNLLLIPAIAVIEAGFARYTLIRTCHHLPSSSCKACQVASFKVQCSVGSSYE